ncbi:DUF3892 domain-containing protein [Enterococcus faecalis]|uniref:DUF3892 domain-containing protein n=1 Tax=Enterococcus faecalis TaxID=1351 RepID=UPI002A369217|nr:DUF3892 domain-containing protein [Enterococcus faecalis]MCD4877868.1 DUF3892 domain-containing protein [Enterococcus faecalis]
MILRDFYILIISISLIKSFYKKEAIYDFLKTNPKSSITVDIYPYPELIPVLNGTQKYVRSEPNDTPNDNLLKLPLA